MTKSVRWFGVFLMAALGAVMSVSARMAPPCATPGCLDETFGSSGYGVADFDPGTNEPVTRTEILPDGKILTVGYSVNNLFVARFFAGGALDTGFGVGGVVTLAGTSRPAVVVVPDLSNPAGYHIVAGATVVVGLTKNRKELQGCRLTRLNSDGTLVSSFGSGGSIAISYEPGINGTCLDISADLAGRIVVAGGSNGRLAAARVFPDGSLDSSFGMGGVVIRNESEAFDCAHDWNGNVLLHVASSATPDSLIRLTPTGAADVTFGSSGVVRIGLGSSAYMESQLVVDGSGRIFLPLTIPGPPIVTTSTKPPRTTTTATTDQAIVAFLSNGQRDTTFGTNGVVAVNATADEFTTALRIDASGRLVLLGWKYGGGNELILSRLSASGILDAGFGTGGISTLASQGRPLLAIANDGIIVGNGSWDPVTQAPGKTVVMRFVQ